MRAAASLYHNRERLTVLEGRIERAEVTLLSYLGLYGLATTVIGSFEVVVEDNQLNLRRLALPGAEQLPLPEPDSPAALSAPATEGGGTV